MNTEKISEYLLIGRKDKNWYADCRTMFLDLFGSHRLDLVTKIFAATSINTSLKSNITLFRKALYEIENDLPIGRYLPNIQNQLAKIRAGQELSGRKISSFQKAMSGDINAVVVDVWLLRAFDLDRKYVRHSGPHAGRARSGGPTDRQYTMIEAFIRDTSPSHDLLPCEMSSMIWSGCRIFTNGDKETRYTTILRNRLTNLFNVI